MRKQAHYCNETWSEQQSARNNMPQGIWRREGLKSLQTGRAEWSYNCLDTGSTD